MPAFRLTPQVLAGGDVFHLGRNDAASRIVHLGHAYVRLCSQGRPFQAGKIVGLISSLVFLNIAATNDPISPQWRQAVADIVFLVRIGPWAASVIDPDRLVLLERAIHGLRSC